MWDIQILGVDLYHVLFWLILYSFMGWIWESCYVSIKEKKLVNRGFVTGPVCTIYGVGAMSVYLVLRPLQDHGLWLVSWRHRSGNHPGVCYFVGNGKALPHKLVGLQRTAVQPAWQDLSGMLDRMGIFHTADV